MAHVQGLDSPALLEGSLAVTIKCVRAGMPGVKCAFGEEAGRGLS